MYPGVGNEVIVLSETLDSQPGKLELAEVSLLDHNVNCVIGAISLNCSCYFYSSTNLSFHVPKVK